MNARRVTLACMSVGMHIEQHGLMGEQGKTLDESRAGRRKQQWRNMRRTELPLGLQKSLALKVRFARTRLDCFAIVACGCRCDDDAPPIRLLPTGSGEDSAITPSRSAPRSWR